MNPLLNAGSQLSAVKSLREHLELLADILARLHLGQLPFEDITRTVAVIPPSAERDRLRSSEQILRSLIANLRPAEENVSSRFGGPTIAVAHAAPFIEESDVWWAWVVVARMETSALAEVLQMRSPTKASALRGVGCALDPLERLSSRGGPEDTLFFSSRNPHTRTLGFYLTASQRGERQLRSTRFANERCAAKDKELEASRRSVGKLKVALALSGLSIFGLTLVLLLTLLW